MSDCFVWDASPLVHAARIDRVKSHLPKYYAKLGETPPWEDG